MVSRNAMPQPSGYPTLRAALGDETAPPSRGEALRIEPRMAGSRKVSENRTGGAESSPQMLPPAIERESITASSVCFQCPSCSAWLSIEDPATYTGTASECPTCHALIVGPQLRRLAPAVSNAATVGSM